jgi:hypothetical protein
VTIQSKYNRLLLVALLLVVAYAYVEASGPTSGLCYSTDGTTVTTTYLGGDPYPVPVSAEVRVVDGGYEVTHRALFRRLRVWLPVVRGE